MTNNQKREKLWYIETSFLSFFLSFRTTISFLCHISISHTLWRILSFSLICLFEEFCALLFLSLILLINIQVIFVARRFFVVVVVVCSNNQKFQVNLSVVWNLDKQIRAVYFSRVFHFVILQIFFLTVSLIKGNFSIFMFIAYFNYFRIADSSSFFFCFYTSWNHKNLVRN